MIKKSLAVFTCFFCLVYSALVFGQADLGEVRYPGLGQGRLFTLKLIPAAGELGVYVAGNSIGQIKLDDVQMKATVQVGQKVWTITPRRVGTHFILPTPKDLQGVTAFDLKLNVQHAGKTEDFKFSEVPTAK